MIMPILQGRMGNQMFQIAAAIGCAVKWNYDWDVPTETNDKIKWPNYFKRMSKELPVDWIKAGVFKENGFHFQEIPKHDPLLLDGYFQSEKYFKHCQEKIRHEFALPSFSMPKKSVSLHVRRGDYLTLSNHHPTLDVDYYRKAIWYFIEKGFDHFEVFSDDMDWCRQNLNSDKLTRATFMYHDNEKTGIPEIANAHTDMAMMASCHHHIIANSSFSWWGAWMGINTDKIVIAPKNWFGSALSHLNTKDLLPENWITV
jgi:hypothetical protein